MRNRWIFDLCCWHQEMHEVYADSKYCVYEIIWSSKGRRGSNKFSYSL